MRSKLFVPGSRPELFPKALASAADALSFDLEDSVTPERKDEARTGLARWIQSGALTGCTKTIIVRVNGMDTPYFAADIAALALPGVHLINLPKPASADAVRAAASELEQAERVNGQPERASAGKAEGAAAGTAAPTPAPIKLLLNIESPAALRTAHALASAYPRVAGLQLGLGDLFEPLGIDRREAAAIENAMFMVRMAAGEAGVFAYDSAFANIQDAEGFRAEAQLAKRLGFLGKSCIHPSQIALANEVFRPSDAEIAHSLRVLDAAQAASASGTAAYVVDGRMIDPPFFARAQQVVASARQMGLIA